MRKRIVLLLGVIMMLAAVTMAACEPHVKVPPVDKTKIIKLDAPQNIKLEKNILSWDRVKYAKEYVVFLGDNEYPTSENRLDMRSFAMEGKHEIGVMAAGDGEKFSNSEISYVELVFNPYVEHGYDKEGWEYTLLPDKSGYEVNVGNANISGSITIPSFYEDKPVKRLADEMFYLATGTNMPDWSTEQFCNKVTTSVTLPEHLESIGDYALSGMVRMRSIVIPDSVKELGYGAFYACKNLNRVELPRSLRVIPGLCFSNTALSEIAFPDTLETIGRIAFYCDITTSGKRLYSQLSTVTIPKSVKRIEERAFEGRENLNEFILEDGIELEHMGSGVLSGTPWLSKQPSTGMVYLQDILYCYNGKMPEWTEIDIPSTVKGIAGRAFFWQKNLVKITIPKSVKFIGEWCFFGCSNLTEVDLQAELKVLSLFAFAGTTQLKNLTLPETLEEIGESALTGSGLERIVIPAGVKKIDADAFYLCDDLKEVVILSKQIRCETLFWDCVERLYYGGDEKAWEQNKQEYIEYLWTEELKKPNPKSKNEITESVNKTYERFYSHATVYFYSENKPASEGNYWHEVDGEATAW